MKRVAGRLPGLVGAVAPSLLATSLSLAPLRSLIEQSMVWHMVIQMPTLMLGGWLTAAWIERRRRTDRGSRWNLYGLTGFIAALMVMLYWMLPLTIDRAVVLPGVDAVKIASLWLAGATLRHSWHRAPVVLQVFFISP